VPRTGLQLTEGDVDVFELLFMLGVMSVDQIRRVRYFQPETGGLSVKGNVLKRLSRLRKGGYLRSEAVYTTGRKQILVYRLGDAGLQQLQVRNPRISQTRLYSAPEKTAHQMLHALMVTDCAVRIIESLRSTDVTSPKIGPLALLFYHSRVVADPGERGALRRFATHHEMRFRGEDRTIRPDLVFALQRGKRARLFLLEADRGTEGYGQLEEKVRAYDAFSRVHLDNPPNAPLCTEYSDAIRDLRVLFVARSVNRIDGILRRLRDVPGIEMIRFTTKDHIMNSNMAFDAPWYFLGDGEVVQDTLMLRR